MFKKPKEWSKRYFIPELAGIAFALLGTHATYFLDPTANLFVVAYAAAWAENFGYYSVIFYRDYKELTKHRPEYSRMRITATVLRNLTIEFGTAETIDSLVLRPACMFLGFELFQNHSVATLVGKLIADIGFYALAVVGYELRKKHLSHHE